MGQCSLSVIVPCHNEAAMIKGVLTALARQSLPVRDYEVIVVDDGSSDDMGQVMQALPLPSSFRYIWQSHRGAAAARNLGARAATGDLLLFLDGDIIAHPDLLAQHLHKHGETADLLLCGRLTDLPSEHTNLFYQVMHSTALIDHGDKERQLTFVEGFTGNLSLKREAFLRIGGFDEEFPPGSGFEDVEFIYRAVQEGFRLIYTPEAIGHHDSFTTLESACRHYRRYQATAVLLMNKHPEIRGRIPHLVDKEPIWWGRDNLRLILRKVIRQGLALPPLIWLMKQVAALLERWYPNPGLLRFIYWKVLGSYLLLGFRDGTRRYGLRSGSKE